MWPIMQALYQAGLKPAWSRAAISWKTGDIRRYIHPGELPDGLPPEDIVRYAKQDGKTLLSSPSHRTMPDNPSPLMTQACTQTEPQSDANLIVALQQEVALQKQRNAKKAVECCELHRKLQAIGEQTPPTRLSTTTNAHTQTMLSEPAASNTSSDASAQTDEDVVTVTVPGRPDITIPKSAQPAFSTLLEWCKKQVDSAIKSTIAEMKSTVDDLHAQVVTLQAKANEAGLAAKRKGKK